MWCRHGLTPEESVKKLTQHGVRKGSANACTTGVICGPSIMSVCLRAEWSIGDVLSRYFRFEAAGDQFVAKVAALRDPCDINFAQLPAHFKSTKDEGVLAKIKDAVQTQFGEHLCSMGNLMPVLELSLAVLLERKDYLSSNLAGADPFKVTPLFADPIKFGDELVGLVTHDTDDTMRPTGVPPYTAILVQNARIEKKIDDQDRKFGVMLDTKISQMVHDHGNMSGTHMDEKINGLFERLNEREKERDAATLEQVGQRRERGAAIVEDDLVGNPKRLCMALDWKDGGGGRRLPKTFSFPDARVKQGWTLWWQGSAPENVPFRIINAKRDIFVDGSPERKKQKYLVTEWRRVYKKMESLSAHIAKPGPQEIDRFSEPWVKWIAESFVAAYTPRLSQIVPAAAAPQTRFPKVVYLAKKLCKSVS